jgi:hypothetical protein
VITSLAQPNKLAPLGRAAFAGTVGAMATVATVASAGRPHAVPLQPWLRREGHPDSSFPGEGSA